MVRFARKTSVVQLLIALLCWLLLASSMGWYYTVTYFGKVGWPMPSVETVGALLLYYFSVLNVDTEIQAVHWLLVFPLAGFLWTCVLLVSRRGVEPRPSLSRLALLFALASLPLSIPMPYLVWLAGFNFDGSWSFERMLAVALRRGGLEPWWWLSPLYLSFGAVAFGLHLYVYTLAFPLPAGRAARHFLISGVVFVVIVAMAGAFLSFPLRPWLE